MSRLFTTIFPNQEIPPGAGEGLPYWIFWFMLCIILLLLAFIFLRDKDLRRRLDSFFIGFRKKFKKFRLQQILKREEKKIENTVFELGKNAWSLNVDIPSSGDIPEKIIELEENIFDLTEEKKEAFLKIETLNKDLDQFKKKQEQNLQKTKNNISAKTQRQQSLREKEKEIETEITQKHFVIEDNAKKITQARKELLDLENNEELSDTERKSKIQTLKEHIKKWQQKKESMDEKTKQLVQDKKNIENQIKQLSKETDQLTQQIKEEEHSTKNEIKKFQKEIHEWEKTRDKLSDKIKKIEEEKNPYFKNLGSLANDQRIENKELSIYYSKIDRSEKRIRNINKRIEQET
jgi:chromosome segregation ATPase